MNHLRFPCLSTCQESTVQDMDCDDAFGGYNRSDGIGCTKCDVGSVFLKNSTKSTITITNSSDSSALQHCVPCPDGARLCNGTAVEMLPGYLVRKPWSKRTLYRFLPELEANVNVASQLRTNFGVTVIEA